jgi:DNA polymerase
VLGRGKLPADIVFVGEAPGISEDVLGLPFKGPAGKLLDEIIEVSGADEYRCYILNLIACIPLGKDNAKVSEPPEFAVKACWPRLCEIMQIARPKIVVRVGKHAQQRLNSWKQLTPKGLRPSVVDIVHPAYILRADISQRGLAIQRCEVAIADAIDTVLRG